MIRRLITITLVLTLIILPFPGSLFAGTSRLLSVQALQQHGETFCTAFSINERIGMWVTAAHCASQIQLEPFGTSTIMGKGVWVIAIGMPTSDTAVIQSGAHAPALHLSRRAIQVDDEITVIGYPYGLARIVTRGTVGAVSIPVIHPDTDYFMTSDVLVITVAPGNSGSPVLNTNGDVVGLLWGSFRGTAHCLSIPLEALTRVIATFAEF